MRCKMHATMFQPLHNQLINTSELFDYDFYTLGLKIMLVVGRSLLYAMMSCEGSRLCAAVSRYWLMYGINLWPFTGSYGSGRSDVSAVQVFSHRYSELWNEWTWKLMNFSFQQILEEFSQRSLKHYMVYLAVCMYVRPRNNLPGGVCCRKIFAHSEINYVMFFECYVLLYFFRMYFL